MKRDRRGRFLTAGLSRRLDREAAVGKRRGGLGPGRAPRGGGGIQCEPESVGLEEIGVEPPKGWETETPTADEPDGAGIGRTLVTDYCRLCHGKFSSRSLRNVFGKVPVVVESSEKQRRVEQVFFADFQRLLGVSVQQDPALPPFVCKNCHAQFYKCRSVLKTFIQKVNRSPTGQAKTKTRGNIMHSRLNAEGPCLVDLVTSSPQCLHRLVIWSHTHAGDCQSVPNLQSMLSSQYCGVIQAVWGCEGGHTYVMDTDSDSNTLVLDSAVPSKWNLDKSSESCLSGNGTGTNSGEALTASPTTHGTIRTDVRQLFASSELTLEPFILENQTSPFRNSSHQQLNSTVSLSEKEPHTGSMQGQMNSIVSSDSVAEEPAKDETSDLSEGDLISEDEERERNYQSLDESFSPPSHNKETNKRSVHDETKRPEVPKEKKKPGPKPGWKNKFKPDREELPTIYRCPYQGCTAVYRGPDGMKKHIKEHHEQVRERPCPHPGCNKVFMIDRYLQRHVKLIHTEERNYICDQCGQTFKQRKHLSVHQMRHSGAKPLQCEICGFQCRQRASLKYHMTKHKAEAELEFACDQCGKRFEKAHNLNVHMSMVHPLTQNHDLATPLQNEKINLQGGEENTEIRVSKNVKPELTIQQDSR